MQPLLIDPFAKVLETIRFVYNKVRRVHIKVYIGKINREYDLPSPSPPSRGNTRVLFIYLLRVLLRLRHASTCDAHAASTRCNAQDTASTPPDH